MMITIFFRILAELACMLAAVTVASLLYLMGDSSGALTALLICYGLGRMVAVTTKDRAAFTEFQKQRSENL